MLAAADHFPFPHFPFSWSCSEIIHPKLFSAVLLYDRSPCVWVLHVLPSYSAESLPRCSFFQTRADLSSLSVSRRFNR